MVRRSRVIFTRSSRSARWRGPAGTAGFAAGAAAEPIEDSAASTSDLVARPSLPEGWIADAATPFSSASLRAAGPDAARLAAATAAKIGAGAVKFPAGVATTAAGFGGAATAAGFGALPLAP